MTKIGVRGFYQITEQIEKLYLPYISRYSKQCKLRRELNPF